MCVECGAKIVSRRAKLYCGTTCRNRGIAKSRRSYQLDGNPAWKGGKKIDPLGYVLVKHPAATRKDGYIQEHRLVMMEVLGRELMGDEQIHHIDGDKTNNDINNLRLMSKSEHMRLHALENNERRRRDKYGRYA